MEVARYRLWAHDSTDLNVSDEGGHLWKGKNVFHPSLSAATDSPWWPYCALHAPLPMSSLISPSSSTW